MATATIGLGPLAQSLQAAGEINTVLPVISGTLKVGSTLSSDTGTWTDVPPSTFTYQWFDCNTLGVNCLPIAGATASTYTLQPSDAGVTIRVDVTDTDSTGPPGTTASSAATALVSSQPSNNTPPSIGGGGSPGQGDILTAAAGSWVGVPAPAFSYQWQDCNGASCSNIAGATGSNYTVVRSDVGLGLRLVVTGSNTAGSSQAMSSITPQVSGPPVNSGAPSISGTPAQGSVLTATTGSWTGYPAPSFTNQWEDCNGSSCVIIGGATSLNYAISRSDVGSTIKVVVTASNGAGSVQATSAATAAIVGAPQNTLFPSISGSASQNSTLTESDGSWTGYPAPTFTRQWEDCDSGGGNCVPIANATSTSYTLAPTDLGFTVRVVIIANNGVGSPVTATSPATAVVTGGPVNVVLPTIAGSASQGSVLSGSVGQWNGQPQPSYTLQWEDCDTSGLNCVPISGATHQTYTVAPADLGFTIALEVTATNGLGSSSALSAPTALVTGGPVNTALPAIAGTTAQGQTLTATTGSWTGLPAPTFSFQWLNCNTVGSNCFPVVGATAQTYTLGAADAGTTIAVLVTATNTGGAVGAVSARTAVVTKAVTTSTGPTGPVTSATSVTASPATPVTNEAVTLTATVTSAGARTGAVAFALAGGPISGCTSQGTDAAGAATCSTSFAAKSSPARITATFTPAAGGGVSSSSGSLLLTVGPDATKVTVRVPATALRIGQKTIYTAVVSARHGGATAPSGAIAFFDGGKPIGHCARQKLQRSRTSWTATCSGSYSAPGKHRISARFLADANFGASSSTARTVTVRAAGAAAASTILTTMQWTFFHSPTYTKVVLLRVDGPPEGGQVILHCSGRGCPWTTHVVAVANTKACRASASPSCKPTPPSTIDLTPIFRSSHLGVGARLEVQVVRPGWVGKYYSFVVAPTGPTVKIDCLAPGSSRPGVGCS